MVWVAIYKFQDSVFCFMQPHDQITKLNVFIILIEFLSKKTEFIPLESGFREIYFFSRIHF